MPYYNYRCNECGHEFEARQRMLDAPLADCPVCTGDIRRVVSRVGVVFKGSGFYVTDNRNGKHKDKGNGANGKADSTTSDTGETKSEPTAKSADKPAAKETASTD